MERLNSRALGYLTYALHKKRLREAPYACLAVGLFFLILFWGQNMSDGYADALLGSYAALVELFYNTVHLKVPGMGYKEIGGAYTLERNCIGANFTALFFLTCSVHFLSLFEKGQKLLWIGFCLVAAFFVGYAANAVRVLASIPFVHSERFVPIHLLLGLSTYLPILGASHFALTRILGDKTSGSYTKHD